MSRRKQAKPRLWKREEEEGVNADRLALASVYENNSFDDKEEPNEYDENNSFPVLSFPVKTEYVTLEESGEENDFKEDNCTEDNFERYSQEYLSRNTEPKDDDQFEHFLPDEENSLDSDTLGTEGGSSWVSEDHTTSPGSSCTTPNSTTEAPDSELSFTVGVTDSTPHACRYCDKAFPRQSYLKKHQQIHADCMPFRCEYCARLFKHKRSRDRHIKLHTGDKKYKCNHCDSAFSRSDHLKIHMKTHDNQKPFQCTVCNRGYNTAAALTSHMQNHKRTNENPSSTAPPGTTFKCLQCTEIFRKPEDLQNHMNSHQSSENSSATNGRLKTSFPLSRLTCTYCMKDNFSTTEALHSHMQSAHKSILNGDIQRDSGNRKSPAHLRVSPPGVLGASSPLRTNQSFNSLPSYFCDLCTMQFTSLSALRKHTSTAHPSQPYNNWAMPDWLAGKIYCLICTSSLPNWIAFFDHMNACHSMYLPITPNLPKEEIKPTDLTVSRKPSTIKRSVGDDQQRLLKQKCKVSENSSGTSPHLNNRCYEFSNTLLCSQCNAAFVDFESFRTHVKVHIDETSSNGLDGSTPPEPKRSPVEFSCPHCRDTFASVEEIGQHVMTHFLSSRIAFICDNCRKSFDNSDELQKHLMEVHALHLYSCSICKEVFDSKVTIQLHFASKHNNEAKVFRCSGCPKSPIVYHSELEFASHVKLEHTNASFMLPSFAPHANAHMLCCLICHTNFSNELEMQLHLATHGKPFRCTLCPQTFHIAFLLERHMQTVHSSPEVNGTQEHDSINEPSKSHSPSSRFNNQCKKMENGDPRGSFVYCDICEKNEFASEIELLSHKKLFHHRLPSPAKVSNENSEVEERAKSGPKQKASSTSTSPTIRFDGGKKMESFNGDTNGNGGPSCELCEKRDFANEADLQSHKKLVHHTKLSSPGKLSLHCAYCKEYCKSRTDLENHMKSHSQNSTSTGKHKCNICDEMCPTASILAEHKLTHCKVLSGKTCMHCKGSITTEEQFYSHIQQHNTTNGNNTNNSTSQLILPTVCVICRQTLVSELEAGMHARFHLQSAELAPCTVCYQTYEKSELVGGVCRECYQRHGKSSPFRCPECHMKFDNGSAIEIHLATMHRKHYTCVKCKMNFNTVKEIQQHVASHIMMDGLGVHECRLCHHVLQSPIQLQTHLIEHMFNGCGPYSCYLCSSVFSSAESLQTHMLEHSPSSRPFDCSRCAQKFFFHTELQNHKCVHMKDMALAEEFFYGSEKGVRDGASAAYSIHPSVSLADNALNNKISNKYSCSECGLDFRHANDLYDHKNHFHQPGRYLNGDHNRGQNVGETPSGESTVGKYEEPKDLPVEIKIEPKKQSESESEDEQIDVVTTKVEDEVVEQNEKTE